MVIASSLPSMNSGFISVHDFGATGDGKKDDTAAIKQAVQVCLELSANINTTLYFPAAIEYKTTQTIQIPPEINVYMDSPLAYSANNDEPALVIGDSNHSNINVTLQLDVVRRPISNWSHYSNIGIQLINATTSQIKIVRVHGFTVGVQCLGDRNGFAYNQLELGEIINNKIGLECSNVNTGWCNENMFLNGSFACYTDTNPLLSRYGVRISSMDGKYANNNNNLFIKPSFELHVGKAGNTEGIPIVIEYGNQNSFLSCRHEFNSDTFARVVNKSSENHFEVGYSKLHDVGVEDKSEYPASSISVRRDELKEKGKLVFQSKEIFSRACYYDGKNQVHVPGLHVGYSNSKEIYKSGDGMTVNSEYLEIPNSRGVGIFIHTDRNKRFLVRRDVIPSYEGRVFIRCYDNNGNILDETKANHPYVKGYSFMKPFYFPYYGNGYLTGVDSSSDYYFAVHEDVDHVDVLITAGSKYCRLKGFSVFSLDEGECVSWIGYEEIIPGVSIGTAPPTKGNWKRGKLILNDRKVELGEAGNKHIIEGWECIADGMPGTWVAKICQTGN